MDKVNTKKVLIVEDDKDFVWLLREGFEGQGLTVLYAQTGEEGLAMAQKENPDLLIIDILLPGISGIAMARKIQSKGLKPLMIFLTNLKDETHISDAIEISGQADYMIKSDVSITDIVARAKSKLGV